MLVLSRKVGQRIVIGENITVVVSRVAGNRVTLGIQAPDDVHILRGELERHQREFESPGEGRSLATVPFRLDVELDSTTPCVPPLAR